MVLDPDTDTPSLETESDIPDNEPAPSEQAPPALAGHGRPRSRYRRRAAFESNEESEEWVISYMDMVTLIMCAFVVIAALLDMQSPHAPQALAAGMLGKPDSSAEAQVPQAVPPLEVATGKGEGIVAQPLSPALSERVDQDQRVTGGDVEHTALAADPPPAPRALDQPAMPSADASPPKSAEPDSAANDAKVEEAWRSAVAAQGLDGRVTISAKGRIVTMQIQDEILFATGDADLQTGGRDVIRRIAPLLAHASGDVRVEGHTDNVPIANERFASNWELSSARADSVVRALIDAGIAPVRLRATGYADTRPVQSNDTDAGRSRNRRVSLLIEQ